MQEQITKPMLASNLEADKYPLQFPVISSYKYDGIRCLIINGKAVSRNFKPIPNEYVRNYLEANCVSGLDGELMVPGGFRNVSSGIMSFGGEPDFEYHVFDYVVGRLTKPYINRLEDLNALVLPDKVKIVPTVVVHNMEALLVEEEAALAAGYEGLMTRNFLGGYKCGRASSKSGDLLKIKRFDDSEALIIGYEEQMENTNFADKDAFGRTKRSSCKDGMVPKGTLGAWLGRDLYSGVEFSVGSGMDDLTRQDYWDRRDEMVGSAVFKYKYQGVTKDKPRFPIFQGLRPEGDRS